VGVPDNPLVRLLEHEDWYRDALCAQSVAADQAELEDWHGDGTELGRTICSRCPVQEQCLDTAIARREKHDIWGGLTPDERKKLRRDRLRRHTA